MKASILEFKTVIFLLSFYHEKITNGFSQQPPCVPSLFPHLNQHWEQFMLYYFYTNHSTIFPMNFLPSQEIFPRHINIQQNVNLDRGSYRYSNTYNVIFSPFFVNDAIQTFSNFVVPSRTLLVYISDPTTVVTHYNKVRWDLLLVFPALKILIGTDPLCNPTKTVARYICSGHCSDRPIPFVKFYKQLLQSLDGNLLTLHKRLFRTGFQRKIIPMIIEDRYTVLDLVQRVPSNPCMSRKRIPLHHFCQWGIMLAYTFFFTQPIYKCYFK